MPSEETPTANVVSFTQAAKEKDCGRTTLYRARDRDELTVVQVGSRGMILRDDAFENWQPKGPGGRPRQQQSTAQG
jgi:hypothetical protein